MSQSQKESHFEENTPASGKRVLNKSKLKDNKIKSNKNILILYYFLGYDF